MKKQILIGSAVFAAVFIVSLWLMFPYGNLVAKGVKQAGQGSGLSISYSSMEAGPFSTSFKDLEINGVPIGNLKASYSPLSLITRSVGVKTNGLVNSDSSVSPSKTEYTAEISQVIINNLAEGKVVLNSPLGVKGTGNPNENAADFKAFIDKIEVDTPIGKLPFEKIEADISVRNSDITVNSLTSQDDMKLNLKGVLKLNLKSMERSVANINGTANVFGEEKKIRLMGRFDNIQPSIK